MVGLDVIAFTATEEDDIILPITDLELLPFTSYAHTLITHTHTQHTLTIQEKGGIIAI